MPVAVPVARFRGSYDADAPSVAAMRGEVAAVARECGMEGDPLDDVRLAVSEAATNAVLHGSTGRDDARVSVSVDLTDVEMLVTVADDGDGLRPQLEGPGLGVGLFTIAALTGHLDIRTGPGGTEVHMAFPIPE